MSDSRRKQLVHAEKLMYEAKFNEALDIIENLEKKAPFTPEDKLLSLILRGKINLYKGESVKAEEIAENAYRLSQKQGVLPESIDAIIFKAQMLSSKNNDEAIALITEAENVLTALGSKSSKKYSRLKADILYFKSSLYRYNYDYNNALESALECLALRERIGKKIDIANTLTAVSYVYLMIDKVDEALEYSIKSLALEEELGNPIGIARSLNAAGRSYIIKGDFDKASKFLKQSLLIKEIKNTTKGDAFWGLGNIALKKGELDLALKHFKQAASLTEEKNNKAYFAHNLMWIGFVYNQKKKYEHAIEYLERSLKLSKKIKLIWVEINSLNFLVIAYLGKKSREEAENYLAQLKELADQTKNIVVKNMYMMAKVYVLKTSRRMRDLTEAEQILKNFIGEDDSVHSLFHVGSMVLLCDLLLNELSKFNNLEVLDEINTLITRLLNISEKEHSFWWLAETKLLQAKLTLIQLDPDGAKKILVQAQRIAELHELNNLAQRISREHDHLLEQEVIWNNLKKVDAPMSERINLASFRDVLDRLQGKHSFEPPSFPPEVPVLLLIIAEGGIPAFSNPFTEDWSYEDGFISNFLAAFNTFSEEVFAKGLDRAKFGEYTIITKPLGFFSVCYLFKGQSYLAKQKLTKFIERVENNASIWEIFKNFHKTHHAILLSENAPLEKLITEIFIKKNLEISPQI